MTFAPCNFRPVFPGSASTKSANFYRSSSIDDGDLKSVQWLREVMGVKCYMDLRSSSEFHPKSKLGEFYILQLGNSSSSAKDSMEKSLFEPGRRFHVCMFTFKFFVKAVIPRLNLLQTLILIMLIIQHFIFGDYRYFSFICQHYGNQISLGRFYCDILDYCPDVFNHIFVLMADESNFPMIIACNYGKDRTGVVAAIAMELTGCSDQLIISEYSQSQNLLKPMQEKLNSEMNFYQIRQEFIQSSPKAMEMFLHYLKNKYGGSEGYLKFCGVTNEQIEKIKNNIMNK